MASLATFKAFSSICKVLKSSLVVGSKNISDILGKYASTKIGVYELTEEHKLLVHQEPKEDNKSLNHSTLFKLLRKNEYLEVIESFFEFVPDVPNTKIFKECLKLSSLIEVRDLQRIVFKKLKKRKLKCPDRLRSEATPYELKHVCYTLDLSEAEYDELYAFLKTKF